MIIIQEKTDRIFHPTKMIIMKYLYLKREVRYRDLVTFTGLTSGNLLGHLKYLKKDGLIEIQTIYYGKRKDYTLYKITEYGERCWLDFCTFMKNILE